MTYDGDFYDDLRHRAIASAAAVVPILIEITHPTSVVDVGCGTGGWLAEFQRLGVDDVTGIDHDVPAEKLDIDPSRFVRADLTQRLPVRRRFDLALCLEVVEHLEPAAGDELVATLTRLAPVVALSAAIPHQGGTHHVNEQWPSYWAQRFAAAGFASIDCLRRRLWHDERVEWWYAQNLIVYADAERIRADDTLSALAETWGGPPPALVHPVRFEGVIEWAMEQHRCE